jgi:hypothetical protein
LVLALPTLRLDNPCMDTLLNSQAAGHSAPLEGTASAALAISRVKYSHDALIDVIIATPGVKQGDLAKHFGYTQAWVSRIINSDAFQLRLAQRKADVIDPSLVMSIDERLKALADRSLSKLLDKLEVSENPDFMLKTAELATKSLGYGARAQNVNVQQNFVVPLPQVSQNASEWAAGYRPKPPGSDLAQMVEEVQVKEAEE